LIIGEGEIFRILAAGPFAKDNISVEWNPTPKSMPSELREEIASFWNDIKRTQNHYNGALARLDEWAENNDNLRLYLSPTDYSTLLFSNSYADTILRRWGEALLSRALGISAVVVSVDERILFMKRSGRVGEYPNCYDVFGGHISLMPDESRPDIFASMRQELQEELALKREDYTLELIGLIENIATRKPELVFTALAEKTSAEIMAMARRAADRYEYVNIFDIRNNRQELETFLAINKNDFSPSAFGSLCLYDEIALKTDFITYSSD